MQVVRTPAEIEAVFDAAQAATFAADDREEHDYAAEAVYQFIQWLSGNEDNPPEFGDEGDEEDDDE